MDEATTTGSQADEVPATAGTGPPDGRVAGVAQGPLGPGLVESVLRQNAGWVRALLILSVVALGFVVLGFLAAYFKDYFHIILIIFLAWLLAFLLNPAVDFLGRRLHRLPRPLAVIGVLVPILLVGALIAVRVLVSVAESIVALAKALPTLGANPPSFLADVQAWLDSIGVKVDVSGAFQTFVHGALDALVHFAANAAVGIVGSFGLFIDGLMIVTLAVFMVIDKDRILGVGLDLLPPSRREEALMFRKTVGFAFAGFIRAQLALGAIYGVWALIVCLLLGIPYAPAAAFLAGAIMAIPIYGPYVSWLPPVLIALVSKQDVALVTAALMLVGWFIDENILAPLVRAGAVDLHPIVVTVAFLIGAQMAGAIGALVAIPVAAIITSFFFYYLDRYRAQRGWSAVEATTPGAGLAPEPGMEVPT